jgi:hypothetical protein
MRKVIVAAFGALLLTITFASEASAQHWRGAGWHGGGIWRAGWGWGYRPWAHRPYRPLWGAAAFGAAAALSYASYPSYSYPYGYGYRYPYAYTSYDYAPVYSYASYGYAPRYTYARYGSPYAAYAFAECTTRSRLIWNGWAYRRVWGRTC